MYTVRHFDFACVEIDAGASDDDEACSSGGDSRISGRLKAQVRQVPSYTCGIHSTTTCRKLHHRYCHWHAEVIFCHVVIHFKKFKLLIAW